MLLACSDVLTDVSHAVIASGIVVLIALLRRSDHDEDS